MAEQKSLKQIVEGISYLHLQGPEPAEVTVASIVTDSRKVTGDALFVALGGEKHDGHDFVTSVLEAGCSAVLVEKGKLDTLDLNGAAPGITVLAVDESRAALGKIAAAFYDFPENELSFIGITGTNGKTTITYLLEKILEDQGKRVGVIGTVNYRYTAGRGEKHEFPAPFTTPDPVILQKLLRQMADAGVETVLMEVSSHALALQRLGSIAFDIAVFSNLSHDHLDYHRSMEEYFQAKTVLFFHHLKESGTAVVTFKDSDDALQNRWSSALRILLQERGIEFVTCGRDKSSIIQPLKVGIEIDRTTLSFLSKDGAEYALVSPLVGRFNADNIMTTLAIVEAMKLDMTAAVTSMHSATGAPGRLERVRLQGEETLKAAAFVDYAHTPDALFNVLSTLKGLPHNRLICVFGCGGDRDAAKRPEMGRIAARLADVAIVTEDNPRSESSEHILAQIMDGIRLEEMTERSPDWLMETKEGKGYVVIPDRREAIHSAVQCAVQNDVVVVAGKGHEKYQLTNRGKRFFDDSLEVREALLSWDAADVAKALDVTPANLPNNLYFEGICTDSRVVEKRLLFVALRGDTFDGHDYLNEVIALGAGGLVVSDTSRVDESAKVPVYRVADTLTALGDLAAYRRRKMARLSSPLVVGITGSTGKTTVKEMTAAIFEQQWPNTAEEPSDRVLRTRGNFNNLIGLPLSLLPLQLKHKVAVLEMGMNRPGEISRLAEIADPDIRCIINVHGAHLEGLGSIEGVAREKAELYRKSRPECILVVNLDDRHVREAAEKFEQRKVTWSMDDRRFGKADVFATDVGNRKDGNISFQLHIAGSNHPVNLKVPGRHNVANSLAAAAIGYGAGVGIEVIVRGLEAFSSSAGRLQVVSAAAGYAILNDTYNANPASMAAGLGALSAMEGGSKIAILGDMLELGASSDEAHKEVGRIAAQAGLNFLALVGSFAGLIAEGAVAAGMESSKVVVFADKQDIPGWMKELEKKQMLPRDSWVLVKASRGMRMETVVEKLVAR
jgi:murE/murF fusion protein